MINEGDCGQLGLLRTIRTIGVIANNCEQVGLLRTIANKTFYIGTPVKCAKCAKCAIQWHNNSSGAMTAVAQ